MSNNFYIAYNPYASETDSGFANTWQIYQVESRAAQARILKENAQHWGYRLPVPGEVEEAKRKAARHGGYIEKWEG